MTDFSTVAYGKWILAGEHAVLRGGTALVLPITSKYLTLNYHANQKTVKVTFNGIHLDRAEHVFWQTMERALTLLGKTHQEITGHFHVNTTLSISSGMGASAAFCVALTRWFIWKNWLAKEQLFTFARELENVFHTKSSGADIAVSIAGQGIEFHATQGYQPLTIHWKPNWYLSHSGMYSATADCVRHVQALWQKDPQTAEAIDQQMQRSVTLAKQALQETDVNIGKQALIQAIEQAADCFQQWGLIPTPMRDHLHQLKEAGAIACKPTGAGGGGLVLSVWDKPISPPIRLELLKV